MRSVMVAVLLACAAGEWGAAAAQDWPTRPITLVVPFSAGGPVDVAARLIAPRVAESLGQQIVIENMAGAGGMTGSNRVAKATPDGYLLVLGNAGTHAYNQSLYKKPLYNSETEFAPVGVVLENTKVLILRKDFPASTIPEFVAEGERGEDAIRLGRRRLGHAHRLPPAQLSHGHQRHPRALSRRRPGAAGPHRRPHRFHVRGDLDRPAADPEQPGEADRAAFDQARRGAARASHRAGAGPRRRRCRRLERAVPSQGNSGADHPPPQCRRGRRAEQSGARAPHGRAGPERAAAGAPHARAPRQAAARGNREMGAADQGERHQRGLTARARPYPRYRSTMSALSS